MAAIKLPSQITHSKQMAEEIKKYANELAVTAIILSDHYMKELYEVSQQGYMFCLDLLNVWAMEFVEKYAHVEEWEEFVYSEANPYKGTMCWDDVVIAFGEEKLNEFKK